MTTPGDKLARTVKEQEKRIEELEKGSRSPQLAFSSIDVDSSRGYIPILKDGVERARIGRQPDGSITTVSMNNTNPPITPSAPNVSAIIGGLAISVDSLPEALPYDFSHLRVYVNNNVDGVITRVPGIWIASPLDPDTQYNITVTAVNQSGTESAHSPATVESPLRVVDRIDVGEITETFIGDDAISTPKLQALAITAAKMAANSITAEKIMVNAIKAQHIEAGSVTAAKLAAEIILANQTIICGNAIGRRVQITENGVEQYDEEGRLLISIGSNPAGGNLFTIVDPSDVSIALATVAANGTLSVSGLSVVGNIEFNGYDFYDIIGSAPRGIQAYGRLPTDSPSTNGEIGIYELSFYAYQDRLYKCSTSSIFIGGNGAAAIRIHYTTDGSRPTTGSRILVDSSGSDNFDMWTTGTNNAETGPTGFAYTQGGGEGATSDTALPGLPLHRHNIAGHWHGVGGHTHTVGGHAHTSKTPQIPAKVEAVYNFPTGRIRLLYTIISYVGTVFADTPIGDSGMQFYVEDIGPVVTSTGGASVGTGTGSGGGAQYTNEWIASYSRAWQNNFTSGPSSGRIYQGADDNNNHVSVLGFDYNAIQSQLVGAQIQQVELYLYCSYSTNSSGVLACIGTHNISQVPIAYSYVERGTVESQFLRPQGKWITMPINVGEKIRDNQIKGFVFDTRHKAEPMNAGYYGEFLPPTETNPVMRPKLKITYTK